MPILLKRPGYAVLTEIQRYFSNPVNQCFDFLKG